MAHADHTDITPYSPEDPFIDSMACRTVPVSSNSNVATIEHDSVPDHPCNYCHLYHWYAGANATPCLPGTKLPRPKSLRHANHPRIRRQHLPNTNCKRCGTKHWVTGPAASRCPTAVRTTERKYPLDQYYGAEQRSSASILASAALGEGEKHSAAKAINSKLHLETEFGKSRNTRKRKMSRESDVQTQKRPRRS